MRCPTEPVRGVRVAVLIPILDLSLFGWFGFGIAGGLIGAAIARAIVG